MFKVAFKVVCHPKYCFFVQNKLKLDGKNIYWSGRQDIFVTQKPVDLDRLAEIAKIQNTRRTTRLRVSLPPVRRSFSSLSEYRKIVCTSRTEKAYGRENKLQTGNRPKHVLYLV